jgi:hypothetical protein
MINAKQIPEPSSFSKHDIRAWWDNIIELGLNIHPDDDVAEIVMIATGEPALDSGACTKLRQIMDSIQLAVGDLIYEIGHAAYMANLGYVKGPSGQDWIRAPRD